MPSCTSMIVCVVCIFLACSAFTVQGRRAHISSQLGDFTSTTRALGGTIHSQSDREFVQSLRALATLLLALDNVTACFNVPAHIRTVATDIPSRNHVSRRGEHDTRVTAAHCARMLAAEEDDPQPSESEPITPPDTAPAVVDEEDKSTQSEPSFDESKADSTAAKLSELKTQFRLLAARTNRGFVAQPAQREALRDMADRLEEALASTVDDASWSPTTSPLLLGRWYLDFTDASDILSLSLLPVPAELGEIYQEVRPSTVPEQVVIDNGVELLPPGAGVLGALTGINVKGIWSVEGACKPISPSKVSVVFVGGKFQPLVSDSFSLPAAGGTLPDVLVERLQQALGAVGEPIFLETTYLDEDMRIGRGPRRELYVLSKRDP